MTPDEFRKKFDEALQARDRDDVDEGIRMLEELLLVGQHRAAVLGTLGSLLLYEKEDAARAEPLLRELIALSPRSERGSLAFFHSLIGIGRVDDAFAEAGRFLQLRDSEEYRRLLKDIADGCADEPS